NHALDQSQQRSEGTCIPRGSAEAVAVELIHTWVLGAHITREPTRKQIAWTCREAEARCVHIPQSSIRSSLDPGDYRSCRRPNSEVHAGRRREPQSENRSRNHAGSRERPGRTVLGG